MTIDPGNDEGQQLPNFDEDGPGRLALYCVFIRVYWFVLVQHGSKLSKYKFLYSFVLTCMLLYTHVYVFSF